MSRQTERLTTYLGTCPVSGKRQHETVSAARKAARKAGKGLHPYWCVDCRLYHVGHMGSATREHMRARRREPSEQAKALAELYQAMPTTANWNAFVKALNIPADRAPMRGPDPTATTAVARVDRERKSS